MNDLYPDSEAKRRHSLAFAIAVWGVFCVLLLIYLCGGFEVQP